MTAHTRGGVLVQTDYEHNAREPNQPRAASAQVLGAFALVFEGVVGRLYDPCVVCGLVSANEGLGGGNAAVAASRSARSHRS